jgi:hypothetical protein
MPEERKKHSDTNKKAFSKLRTLSLDELCQHFEWSRSVSSFVTPRATFGTVLQSLLNHECWFDAASLLSHAMPQREAIWWGARVCDDYLSQNKMDDASRKEEEQVLAAARLWVTEPEDDNRMATHAAAAGIPNRVPSHWVGMAVFWAAGNITPDAGVVTPPPPYLYARGVSAAIDLAASLTIPEREKMYQIALGRGLDIASGGDGETIAKLQIAR